MPQLSDDRLYVALDVPTIAEARAMVETLGDAVSSYKIGLQLLPLGGAQFGQELKALGNGLMLWTQRRRGAEKAV